MNVYVVYNFPPFDAGLFDEAELTISGGNARLLIRVAEHSNIALQFQRARWHEFTALPNCSADQVNTAYFKVVRLDESKRLTDYVGADSSPQRAYKELHYYRVFLDEHGCHEIFAESFTAVPESGQWQQTA